MQTDPPKEDLNTNVATLIDWLDKTLTVIFGQYPSLRTPTRPTREDSLAQALKPLDENGMTEWRGKIGIPSDPRPSKSVSLFVRAYARDDETSTLEIVYFAPRGTSLDAAVDQVFKEALFRFGKVEQQPEPEPAQQQEAQPPKETGKRGRDIETWILVGMIRVIRSLHPDDKLKDEPVATALNDLLKTKYDARQIRHAREVDTKPAR